MELGTPTTGRLRRITLLRCWVNKPLGRASFPCLSRLWDNAELLHHAQVVPNPPLFDGKPVTKAHEMHVSLSHPAPCRRRTHQGSFVGTTHRQTSRHGVPFGDQTFDLEVQVGEGRAQHVGQSPHRLGTAIHPGRGFVVYEVGSYQI